MIEVSLFLGIFSGNVYFTQLSSSLLKRGELLKIEIRHHKCRSTETETRRLAGQHRRALNDFYS